MIMCPYCLTMQEPLQANMCNNPKCGEKFPPKYVENARSSHLVSLGTFGLSGHGKTALLSSLMQSVQGVTKIASGTFVNALDDATRKKLNEWSRRFKTGEVKLPSTTPDQRPKPLLVMNNKFATRQPQVLIAYDLAGEVLQYVGSQPEYIRALNKVNTIWCVVSLDDLVNANDEGYALDSLFSVYLDAMADLHISIRDKNILIVYTKADILVTMRPGVEPLPLEVENYLMSDPYSQLRDTPARELPPFDEDAYFAQMQEISDILLNYTIDHVDGGGAFVNLAQDAGANVYFTVNSAYGSSLDANTFILGMKVHAIRVLDVLIWAMKLNRPPEGNQEAAMIVPSTISSANVQNTIARFYEELSGRGSHVATWIPGRIEPAFTVGTPPIGIQTSGDLSLIGPILDQLKPGTAVVLLVDDELPMDLNDLYASIWQEKVLLVVTKRSQVVPWLRHCKVLSHDGEIVQMVGTFLDEIKTSRGRI